MTYALYAGIHRVDANDGFPYMIGAWYFQARKNELGECQDYLAGKLDYERETAIEQMRRYNIEDEPDPHFKWAVIVDEGEDLIVAKWNPETGWVQND